MSRTEEVLRQAQGALQDLTSACKRAQASCTGPEAAALRASLPTWQLSNATSAIYAIGAVLAPTRGPREGIDWTAIDARLDKAVQNLGWNRAQHELYAIVRDVARMAAGAQNQPPAPAVAWALFNRSGIVQWRAPGFTDPAQWADQDGRLECAKYDSQYPDEAPFRFAPLTRSPE